MKILSIGSLNVDYFYSVDHITQRGETQNSTNLEIFAGGKGLNQSIALAKAGLEVYHGGFLGQGGQMLLDTCIEHNINTEFLHETKIPTGTAIIQVDNQANNCIIVYGGSNQILTEEFVDETISAFDEGDFIILQNEVNQLDYIIDKAYERGLKIVLNPSPFDDKILKCDLSKVWLFLLNEVEGAQISGKTEPAEILNYLKTNFPNAQIVLTLGENGSCYSYKDEEYFQDIVKTNVVDTTAAGDTFAGYFVYGLINELSIPECLKLASTASSITITQKGTSSSIPKIKEVLEKYNSL